MATPLPDFSDTAVFRTFLTIPQDDEESAPAPTITAAQDDDDDNNNWYLLAQIKDNMTINKPTLVLTDRDANPFALVFEGLGRDDLDLKGLGFKKGCTAVIPCARRTRPADETKRGFVKIEKGGAKLVKAVPGLLARVLEVGGKSKGSQCETCGKECAGGAGELKSCTGCERVGYCSKVSFYFLFFLIHFSFSRPFGFDDICLTIDGLAWLTILSQECQVKGWMEGGHKNDCKMFKALNTAFIS